MPGPLGLDPPETEGHNGAAEFPTLLRKAREKPRDAEKEARKNKAGQENRDDARIAARHKQEEDQSEQRAQKTTGGDNQFARKPGHRPAHQEKVPKQQNCDPAEAGAGGCPDDRGTRQRVSKEALHKDPANRQRRTGQNGIPQPPGPQSQERIAQGRVSEVAITNQQTQNAPQNQ